MSADASTPAQFEAGAEGDRRTTRRSAKRTEEVDPPTPGKPSLAASLRAARRVWRELQDDNVAIVAAGMAFHLLLATLALLTLLVSVYGLVADPTMAREHLAWLADVLPAAAWEMLRERLDVLTAQPAAVLGFGSLVSLCTSFWAVSKGTLIMIDGVRIAYDARDSRGFVGDRWLAMKLTVAIVLFGAAAVALLAILPAAMHVMGVNADHQLVAHVLRWPGMFLAALVGLAMIYHHAPSRQGRMWRWVTPGSLVASALWLLGSALFSAYVSVTGDYDRMYGSLSGIVVFLLWLFLSAYLLLLGAEINSEVEHRAQRPVGNASVTAKG